MDNFRLYLDQRMFSLIEWKVSGHSWEEKNLPGRSDLVCDLDAHRRFYEEWSGLGRHESFSGMRSLHEVSAMTHSLSQISELISYSTPSAVGIIAHTFTGRARSTAFASFSAGAPVGGALGLILGGLFTSYVNNTWRGALYCVAGLAFAVSICAFFLVPNDGSHSSDRRVDWIGAALVTVGLIFLLFAISDGENAPNGWKTSCA